jgi:hypothetical protein
MPVGIEHQSTSNDAATRLIMGAARQRQPKRHRGEGPSAETCESWSRCLNLEYRQCVCVWRYDP